MNDALRELLTTDVGLMSLGAIVGVIVIGAFLHAWIRRQMRNDQMRNDQMRNDQMRNDELRDRR
jgi:mannose/fructose/N-acetylgalactosamine-specific phosphotransferase system component IID